MLGRTIQIGRAALVIVGVAAADFTGDHVASRTDFWVPLSMQGEVMPYRAWLDNPMSLWLRLLGRLRPGETISHAQVGVNVALQQILEERAGSLPTPEARRRLLDQRITLTSAAAGVSSVRTRFAPSLRTVMGMVALVLLLACTNLATMMLARAAARQKELGLRLALGAGRSRVLRQLLTESLLISVLGALAGVVVERIDGVNSGYTEGRLLDLAQRLTASMTGIGGVASVAVSDNGLLLNDELRAPVTVLGDKPRSDDERMANFDQVSDGYFRTLGVPLVAGRTFTDRDRQSAPRVAIVNASFARYYFGEGSALGRQFRVGDDTSAPVVAIVGVASDVRNRGPREAPDRRFYLSYFQAGDLTPGLQFQLRLSGSPEVVGPTVRTVIRRVDSSLDIESMETVDKTLERMLIRDRLMANLAAAFGVLAMLLAATGLYGVLAYTVTRRSRDIGIRMALGARRAEIVRLVVRDGGAMVIAGAVIGVPAALLVARGLSTQLFGLTAFSPATLAASVLVLLVVAMCAGCLPARQATRVDPLVALRSE